MTKQPKKRTGELGPTKIAKRPDGSHTAEIISARLSPRKEEVESLFATKFVEQFNQLMPLGAGCTISGLKQNGTGDLDFRITCSVADYLELAELNPQSQEFGRSSLRSGKFNIHTYARWIWLKLIKKKQRTYGADTAGRTILLLYSTHWQFLPTDKVPECLTSTLSIEGCQFSGVFLVKTNTTDLTVIDKVWPHWGSPPRAPKEYAGFTGTNLAPGNFTWRLDNSPNPPDEP